jgi:hypothetical protein
MRNERGRHGAPNAIDGAIMAGNSAVFKFADVEVCEHEFSLAKPAKSYPSSPRLPTSLRSGRVKGVARDTPHLLQDFNERVGLKLAV